MWKPITRLLVLLLFPCCLLGIFTVDALGKNYSPLYDQVLEKLESLRPGSTIKVNMGVEEDRYEKSFKLTEQSLSQLNQKIPGVIHAKLEETLKGNNYSTKDAFLDALEETIGRAYTARYQSLILQHVDYDAVPVYADGDKFEMRFQASKDSYIVLMHIAARVEDAESNILEGGDITFFLPKREFPEIKIEEEQVYSTTHHFDIEITAQPPLGIETINLFCSPEKLNFFKSDFGDQSYYTITPHDEEKLKALLDRLDQLEKQEWAGKSMRVRIGPRVRAVPKRYGALPPIGAVGATGIWFPPIGAAGTTGKTRALDRSSLGGESGPFYQQLLEKLGGLTPDNTLTVKMGTKKDQYVDGEPFEIRFLASKDCYVTLMDIAADDENPDARPIIFLLPSFKLSENKIEGGRVYSTFNDIQMFLKTGPPYGVETLNLFCSTKKFDLFEADFKKEPLYTIMPNDEERLQDLLERLNQLEQHEWGGTSVEIRIGPQPSSAAGTSRWIFKGAIESTGTTGKWFPPIGAVGTTGKQ